MTYLPVVGAISPALVRAFAFILRSPHQWWSAAEVASASDASLATIYRRFGNLTAAGVLVARREGDFRHYKLSADWALSPVAAELYRRADDAGLLTRS